jgi:hypothetical protein
MPFLQIDFFIRSFRSFSKFTLTVSFSLGMAKREVKWTSSIRITKLSQFNYFLWLHFTPSSEDVLQTENQYLWGFPPVSRSKCLENLYIRLVYSIFAAPSVWDTILWDRILVSIDEKMNCVTCFFATLYTEEGTVAKSCHSMVSNLWKRGERVTAAMGNNQELLRIWSRD